MMPAYGVTTFNRDRLGESRLYVHAQRHVLTALFSMFWQVFVSTPALARGGAGTEITVVAFLSHYWYLHLLAVVTVGALIYVTLYVVGLNRRIKMSSAQLAQARDELEEQVRRRTAQLKLLNEELKVEINERKQAEKAVGQAYMQLNQIFNTALDGMCMIDVDFTIQRVNDTFAAMLIMKPDKLTGRKCYDLFPGLRCGSVGCPLQQIKSGRDRFEYEDEKLDTAGNKIPCIVTATPWFGPDGELLGAVETFKDIRERKKAELALAEYADELARSNAELRQFAYVASHDLQEPLRMIGSYVQLLARRYKGKLDADADDFINYAVDGANRMQQLIQDLLSYSRVNTQQRPFTDTDCEEVVRETLTNLQLSIEHTRAQISCGPLPHVMADGSQLCQLFQNLIGNAIKFHGDKPPSIHVSAERSGGDWIFSVRDKGIGIDPQYEDKIFTIFQRLHGPDEYPGTGIGLAIAKKIVERHGGRIWMESKPGEGAAFFFTIPLTIKHDAPKGTKTTEL